MWVRVASFSPRLIEDDKGDHHQNAPYYWSRPLTRLEQSQSSTFSRNRPALAAYIVHHPCSRSQPCKVVTCASRVNVNSHRPSTGQVTKVEDQFICTWVIMTLLGICSVWKEYVTSLRFPCDRGGLREAKYPPIEHCLAPFLGLTVQPCGEPCGPAAGFDFFSVEVIQIKKKTDSSQFLNLCQCFVACSTPGRFRIRFRWAAAERNLNSKLKEHY
jgi:hypothetical protein